MSEPAPVLHDGASSKIVATHRPTGLRLMGRIDLADHSALGTVVRQFLDRDGDLYVDLTDLEFIDVSGMRILFDAAAYIADAGRQLIFVGGNSGIRRIIQICGGEEMPNVRVLS